MPETKPSKQHQRGLFLHPRQKGTAEPPPRMQKQPQLPYSMTALRDEDPDRYTKNLEGPEQQVEMLKQHSPTNRGDTAAYIAETTGGWATAPVTTPSRSSRLDDPCPQHRRPLNFERKAERQREQQDRSREPSDQERAQCSFLAPQAEDRETWEEP